MPALLLSTNELYCEKICIKTHVFKLSRLLAGLLIQQSWAQQSWAQAVLEVKICPTINRVTLHTAFYYHLPVILI